MALRESRCNRRRWDLEAWRLAPGGPPLTRSTSGRTSARSHANDPCSPCPSAEGRQRESILK
eukprot:3189688-Heterocapsa_arctica.AAC.1